jgi:hypothetical protein
MALYGVELPIAGWIYLEVEAESREEALKKALAMQWKEEDVQELDSYTELSRGNMMCVRHSKADAYPVKD